MDLNEDEKKALTKLERVEWLVKLVGRYTKPFMIKTKDFVVRLIKNSSYTCVTDFFHALFYFPHTLHL